MTTALSKAVVLVSGGLDSAVVLAIAREQGFRVSALTVDYRQRHSQELGAAKRVAEAGGVEKHVVQRLDLRAFGGSALTADVAVPKRDRVEEIGASIPVTYVPARNTIFLALALAYAESIGASDIFIGVNAVDFSGYPDCRPVFIDAFEGLANLATKAGVEGKQVHIHAPLLRLRKAEIIREGIRLGVDFGITHSCYDPTPRGEACGRCDSCLLRRQGFAEAGLADPTPYARQDGAS
ncbi:MAG: 7-cyano-7-deazaguanine synthase QueC [Planctomycetota bacterium]